MEHTESQVVVKVTGDPGPIRRRCPERWMMESSSKLWKADLVQHATTVLGIKTWAEGPQCACDLKLHGLMH